MESMTKLDEIIAIQCTNGTWNYNEYQFGLANGLLLAKAIITESEPEFMDKPEAWLADGPDVEAEPIQEENYD